MDLWEDEEEEETPPETSTTRSRRNRTTTTDSDDDDENLGDGSTNCRSCGRSKGRGCDCCPCQDEFDDVHCAIEDVHVKVCDIQHSQEEQDICLGIIKGTTEEHTLLLENLQTDVTDILAGVDEIIAGGGAGVGGGGEGNGDGCLVCINCGGCCTDGDGVCCDCCDPIDPPIDPPIGGGGTDPDPCLIGFVEGTDNGILNGDLIELWFSAQFKSCTRDFYLASSSFNWAPEPMDEDYTCEQEGFHGLADGTPGEGVVSQAAMYVKRKSNIPGLNLATTWVYDTE